MIATESPATPRIHYVDGWFDVVSPVCHLGDEKTGNTPTFRKLTLWDSGASTFDEVPVISGNSIRGGSIRRPLMRDMLTRLDYQPHSQRLHNSLFAGGLLESTDEEGGVLDLDLRRRVRDTLPPVALLGLALGNQMFPGCLDVGFAFPVCRQYAPFLAGTEHEKDPRIEFDARTFTAIEFQTRRDDERQGREEGEQALQMKVEYETVVAGTRFVHRFVLRLASEVERSCFGWALQLWQENPTVGGKVSNGHGRLDLHYDGIPDPQPYLSWVEERKDDMREVLAELEAKLGRG